MMNHPKYRWLVIIASLLYILIPVDLLPDFIPLLGWIDDAGFLALILAEVNELAQERRNTIKAERNPKEEED